MLELKQEITKRSESEPKVYEHTYTTYEHVLITNIYVFQVCIHTECVYVYDLNEEEGHI